MHIFINMFKHIQYLPKKSENFPCDNSRLKSEYRQNMTFSDKLNLI